MRIASILVVMAALFVAGVASAADPLRLEVNALEEKPGMVSVVVTAFDPEGKPLSDLSASNFQATLDGEALPVSSIDAPGSGAPVSTGIVLLVDVSGSMYGDPIVQARGALQEFVGNLDSSDQVSVLAFSDGVTELQDFTTNRAQLNSAITRLTPFGDTALYNAVTEATSKAASFQASRKLVVILSDGLETVNPAQRDASIEAARNAGVGIVAVGLGNEIDREYLQTIADQSGGRVVEASTPAALRQAYIDLAASLRSRYTVHITVPPTIDRTVPATLALRLNAGAETTVVERHLEPLAGATVPGFTLTLDGVKANAELTEEHVLTPRAPEGVTLAQVEYFVDGNSVHIATAAPFEYNLNAADLPAGAHLVRAVATDGRGAAAQTEVAFRTPAPATASTLSKTMPVLLVLLLIGAVVGGGFLIISRRLAKHEAAGLADNVVRIRPFAVKSNEEMAPPEDWPERPAPEPIAPPQPLGRVVVMDESVIRDGDLSKIKEYAIGTAPLTLGAGASCDIQIADVENLAMEEARIWVQKGRLVYHKLTTLSAMATEGVTSGWLLLGDGEELHLGKYRLLFQAEVQVSVEEEEEAVPEPAEANSQFMGWSS